MIHEPPLIKGRLLKRYKRFLVDIQTAQGDLITAHCANPGSMAGLLSNGAEVWYKLATNPARKLKYDWVLVRAQNTLVGIHTHMANSLAAEALTSERIPELSGYTTIRREVKYGEASRIDFLLEHPDRRPCYVEVKSITFSRRPALAEFPDSPSVRATKHVGELAHMVQSGARALLLYIVQRADCQHFTLAGDIDPAYQDAIRHAQKTGVESLCYTCHIDPQSMSVNQRIPILDP